MLSRLRLVARLPAPPPPLLLARASLFSSAGRATAAAIAGAPAIRSLLSMRALSSSTQGLSRMGAPSPRELEPLIAGRQGGTKPRRNISGVITINNSWNNTKCNISDTAFQTKAAVRASKQIDDCVGRELASTRWLLMPTTLSPTEARGSDHNRKVLSSQPQPTHHR